MNRQYAIEQWRRQSVRKPFEWGTHDCATGLAGPVILALTGRNLFSEWVGTYSTAFGAIAAMKERGFTSLDDVLSSHFRSITITEAWFGDLALLAGENTGHALGVVIGEHIAVLTPDGLGHVPRNTALKAYRIE